MNKMIYRLKCFYFIVCAFLVSHAISFGAQSIEWEPLSSILAGRKVGGLSEGERAGLVGVCKELNDGINGDFLMIYRFASNHDYFIAYSWKSLRIPGGNVFSLGAFENIKSWLIVNDKGIGGWEWVPVIIDDYLLDANFSGLVDQGVSRDVGRKVNAKIYNSAAEFIAGNVRKFMDWSAGSLRVGHITAIPGVSIFQLPEISGLEQAKILADIYSAKLRADASAVILSMDKADADEYMADYEKFSGLESKKIIGKLVESALSKMSVSCYLANDEIFAVGYRSDYFGEPSYTADVLVRGAGGGIG